jgi:hypothetical protein
MVYGISKLQIQKRSNKGGMTKNTKSNIEFSKAHNFHKHFFFIENFENKKIL